MKVKVIYDFTSEDFEGFEKDIVEMEMSFRDFQGIKHAIIEAMDYPTLESYNYYQDLIDRLNNYETESKD